jgi:hypothetical protein
MMKCGHAANGTKTSFNASNDGPAFPSIPCCVICAPSKEAYEIDENPPDLRAREARCECDARKPSSPDLPFFEHRPSQPFDSFYCGCRGWN